MEKSEYLKLSSKKGTLSLSIPQLSEVNLRARILKRVFLAHPSITGSLFGLFFGLILGILNVTIAIFIFVPLLAGVLAGYLRGNGAKAGVLKLLLPILVILTRPIVFPTVDWAASTMPEVEGIEPVGSTLAVLTNGLIHSTWSIAHGLTAVATALAGILVLILVIMIPILVAVGIVVTAILGFIGGKIGGVTHNYFCHDLTCQQNHNPRQSHSHHHLH